MIDWMLFAIGAVAGGTAVHLAHEWIWSTTARRITRDVMRRVLRDQIRESSGESVARAKYWV